jgi:hypothetical protein
MKRVCSLCLMEFSYKEVKKHKHGLQLCDHCVDVLMDISLHAA